MNTTALIRNFIFNPFSYIVYYDRRLFESVARSCMVKSNHPQQLNNVDGGPVENNNLADIN